MIFKFEMEQFILKMTLSSYYISKRPSSVVTIIIKTILLKQYLIFIIFAIQRTLRFGRMPRLTNQPHTLD